MRQTINLSLAEKKKVLVVIASVSIFISTLFVYFLFIFVEATQEVYATSFPEENERYLRDTQIFWFETIIVIVYLVVEICVTVSWLKSNKKVEPLICVLALLHIIAQVYFSAPYCYFTDFVCTSFFLVTISIDALLLWTFLPKKLKNEI